MHIWRKNHCETSSMTLALELMRVSGLPYAETVAFLKSTTRSALSTDTSMTTAGAWVPLHPAITYSAASSHHQVLVCIIEHLQTVHSLTWQIYTPLTRSNWVSVTLPHMLYVTLKIIRPSSVKYSSTYNKVIISKKKKRDVIGLKYLIVWQL